MSGEAYPYIKVIDGREWGDPLLPSDAAGSYGNRKKMPVRRISLVEYQAYLAIAGSPDQRLRVEVTMQPIEPTSIQEAALLREAYEKAANTARGEEL